MKKKSIIIIVIIMLVLILLSIAVYFFFDKLYPKSRTIKNITLEVKEDTITKTGATFIITNKNDYRWSYSEKYVIQVKKLGVWINQPMVGRNIVSLVVPMVPNGTYQIKANWSKLYGELEKGHYRYGIAMDTRRNEYVFAEFTIE